MSLLGHIFLMFLLMNHDRPHSKKFYAFYVLKLREFIDEMAREYEGPELKEKIEQYFIRKSNLCLFILTQENSYTIIRHEK